MNDTLLPCPFCGGEPHVMHCGAGTYMVQCLQCKATTDDGSLDRISANWNRRDFSPMTVAGAGVAAVANAGWQPIATAPKDGTAIIARTAAEDVFACNWFDDEDEKDGGCWLQYGTDDVRPREWLPMPANSFTSTASAVYAAAQGSTTSTGGSGR